jgi:hypothetical protein
LINDFTTKIVASGSILFVIMAWIITDFGRNPRNGGSPPEGNSDVNIMNSF